MSTISTKQGNATKGWFLTFPKCDKSKEEILDECSRIGTIAEYVVCREMHQDGTPHIHAFIKYSTKKRFSQIKFTRHGHYEGAKCWKAVERYCRKDGDYITSIDVESAKLKKGKHNKYLLTMDPIEAVESGEINAMQLKALISNQQLYQMLKKKTHREESLPKDRHVWYYGDSNTGKTTKLNAFIEEVGLDNCFFLPYNNDFNGYIGQKYLIADEFKGQISVQDLNRICDGNAKVNTKGGSVQICQNPYVIVASNFCIGECYLKCDEKLIISLLNRFNEVQTTVRVVPAGDDRTLRDREGLNPQKTTNSLTTD